ncbi:MAG: DUF1345 domain-containing protein [Mycobacteriaceae bacterium]|uniref:DUF1345 domain-containing protein n=1 Tax=Corynebacterium sp. TaxID=1720 RepID=UPI003F9BFCF6
MTEPSPVDDPSPPPPRRIRSDAFRANVSVVVSLGLTVVVVIALRRLHDFTLPDDSFLSARAILALLSFWTIYTLLYLWWTHRAYSSLTAQELRLAAERDTGIGDGRLRRLLRWLLGDTKPSNLTTIAALFAVFFTIVIALTPGARDDILVFVLTMVTVACSWAIMAYAYAIEYMRLNVLQDDDETPHLQFSFTDEPQFTDYLTFAIMVSTMGVGLPAETTSRKAWRRLRTNVLLAFIFNTVIVAMMVSLLFSSITG